MNVRMTIRKTNRITDRTTICITTRSGFLTGKLYAVHEKAFFVVSSFKGQQIGAVRLHSGQCASALFNTGRNKNENVYECVCCALVPAKRMNCAETICNRSRLRRTNEFTLVFYVKRYVLRYVIKSNV